MAALTTEVTLKRDKAFFECRMSFDKSTEQEKRRGKDGWMGGEGKEGDFHKFEILTASMLCSANLHHSAKFRAGRSSRSGDMTVY